LLLGKARGVAINSMSAVDDIWAKLKAESQPQRQQGGTSHPPPALASLERPAAATRSRHAPSTPQLDPYLAHFLGKASVAAAQTPAAPSQDADPKDQADAPPMAGAREWPSLEAALQKDLNTLQDPDAAVRLRAVGRVEAALTGPLHDDGVLADALEGSVGRALLLRFADTSERVREAAACLALGLIQRAPDSAMSVMPYVMPVLEERLIPLAQGTGGTGAGARTAGAAHAPGAVYTDPARKMLEPSETVRLLLLRIVRCLVESLEAGCAAYAGEVCEIVRNAAEDPFHEVNDEACQVAGLLARTLGRRLQPLSKQLVAWIAPLTTHRRHRVRVAAVRALQEVVMVGAHEMILELIAWKDPNVVPIKAFYEGETKVNFFGKLATDASQPVREAFLDAVGSWVTSLAERKDHEERLLPYLLSGLNDDAPGVAERAARWLDQLGELYERDKAEELKDKLTYLDAEAHGHGWMPAHMVARLETRPYPWPLRGRPRLGCRMLVQEAFNRMYFPICQELVSWQDVPRLKAAALLRTFCLFLEDYAARMLHKVVPAVTAAVASLRPPSGSWGGAGLSTDGARCMGFLEEACHLIGETTEPQMYLKLLLHRVGPANEDTRLRAASLQVLSWLLGGARVRGDVRPHLAAIVGALSDDALLRSHAALPKWAAAECLGSAVAASVAVATVDPRWDKDPEEARKEKERRLRQREEAARDWEERRRSVGDAAAADPNPYELGPDDHWIDLDLYSAHEAGVSGGEVPRALAAQVLRAAALLVAPAGAAMPPDLTASLGTCGELIVRNLAEAGDLGSPRALLADAGEEIFASMWGQGGPGVGYDLLHSCHALGTLLEWLGSSESSEGDGEGAADDLGGDVRRKDAGDATYAAGVAALGAATVCAEAIGARVAGVPGLAEACVSLTGAFRIASTTVAEAGAAGSGGRDVAELVAALCRSSAAALSLRDAVPAQHVGDVVAAAGRCAAAAARLAGPDGSAAVRETCCAIIGVARGLAGTKTFSVPNNDAVVGVLDALSAALGADAEDVLCADIAAARSASANAAL